MSKPVHIKGHINWTNSTADFLTTGTLGAGAATFSGTVTLNTTNEINFRDTDISIGSTLYDGILDISADISIDMFYDNADVGDGVDGQSLNINRRAGEGDDYISLYVDKDRKGLIGFSSDDDLLQLAANALTVAGTIGVGGAAASADNGITAERNISSANTVTAGLFFTANSGTAAESYGTNATNYGSMTGAGNKTAYGGRFQSLLYGMDTVPTATAYIIRGGDFRAGDHSSKTYTVTGTGYFQLTANYAYVLNGAGDWSANPRVDTYGLFIPNTPTGYGTNHTHYAIYTGTGDVHFGGTVNTTEHYEVDGTQVVTNQQAHIADSSTQDLTGTDSVDQTKLESDLANIVAAVNAALAALETHGLLAGA